MKWEYFSEFWDGNQPWNETHPKGQSFLDRMNELGQDGWELVYYHSGPRLFMGIFKRALPSTSST